MRRTDRLKDLLDFCCAILDVPASQGRLAFRGKEITGEETPKDLSMEDWDTVEFAKNAPKLFSRRPPLPAEDSEDDSEDSDEDSDYKKIMQSVKQSSFII